MKAPPQTPTELIPLDLIRTETALCRYPIHRLAKKGKIEIEIKNKEAAFKWEVSYSSKYGQPGPLAYKLDTLIINRRIEDAERPLPKAVKLGSLTAIAETLSTNKAYAKTALYQNAAAFITAKIHYKTKDGSERDIEFGGSRYAVVFTGETLPDGKKADAVYIVPNEWYREIIESAQTRPLDYDYLKDLRPAAQRLYELISFQMYGAIEGERKRAKFLYSEFCIFAPQTRYYDFEHVKKQMYKLHLQHRKSGYITAVHFNEITDKDGKPDWEMFYTPGLKARGEHLGAKRKNRLNRPRQIELPLPREEKPEPLPEAVLGFSLEEESLVSKLRQYGVGEKKARELVKTKREAADVQSAAYPYRDTKPTKNAAGWLVTAIEQNFTLPVAYLEEQNKESRTAATKNRAAAEQGKAAAITACQLCDTIGWRRIKTEQYPTGAMKRCSHDPKEESRFQAAN